MYFSPIHVQQLESDRPVAPTKPRHSTGNRALLPTKPIVERSRTNLSAFPNPKPSVNKDRIKIEQLLNGRKIYARTAYNENELKNNTLASFVEGEDNREEDGKMWRSVVTCLPMEIKPMSKRIPHGIEDLQALEEEQSAQDSNGFQRAVLPNIRPIPKSKLLYKGLAYKEVKKISGMNATENEDTRHQSSTEAFKKPLIDYNLAQAYVRHEVNHERTKHSARQAPPSAVKTPPLIKTQTSVDLREIRKRIVKGTTLPYRPLPLSATWAPSRNDKSRISSEVPHPAQHFSTLDRTYTISPFAFTLYYPHATLRTTPLLSQTLHLSPVDNVTNLSSL